jgi:hypothetical protein
VGTTWVFPFGVKKRIDAVELGAVLENEPTTIVVDCRSVGKIQMF